MFDFLMGSGDYPIKAEWFQKNKPKDVNEEVTYEGAVPFRYRLVNKTAITGADVNGLKMTKYNFVIRTKDTLNFDRGDLVRVGDKTYKIDNAMKVDNDAYKNARIIFEHFNDYETEIILV